MINSITNKTKISQYDNDILINNDDLKNTNIDFGKVKNVSYENDFLYHPYDESMIYHGAIVEYSMIYSDMPITILYGVTDIIYLNLIFINDYIHLYKDLHFYAIVYPYMDMEVNLAKQQGLSLNYEYYDNISVIVTDALKIGSPDKPFLLTFRAIYYHETDNVTVTVT